MPAVEPEQIRAGDQDAEEIVFDPNAKATDPALASGIPSTAPVAPVEVLPKPDDPIGVDQLPELVKMVEPIYPDFAQSVDVQGKLPCAKLDRRGRTRDPTAFRRRPRTQAAARRGRAHRDPQVGVHAGAVEQSPGAGMDRGPGEVHPASLSGAGATRRRVNGISDFSRPQWNERTGVGAPRVKYCAPGMAAKSTPAGARRTSRCPAARVEHLVRDLWRRDVVDEHADPDWARRVDRRERDRQLDPIVAPAPNAGPQPAVTPARLR